MNLRFTKALGSVGTLAGILLLSACGGGSSTDGGGDEDDCAPVDASCYFERTRAGDSYEVSKFDGDWLSNCVQVSEFDAVFSTDAMYRQESLSISGQSASRTNRYYADSSCATPATVAEVNSDLEMYYASLFTDGTVLTNITASNFTFDTAAATDDQQAEITSSRADRTLYSSMYVDSSDTTLFLGTEGGFSDGRSGDDRIIISADFLSSTPTQSYTRQ